MPMIIFDRQYQSLGQVLFSSDGSLVRVLLAKERPNPLKPLFTQWKIKGIDGELTVNQEWKGQNRTAMIHQAIPSRSPDFEAALESWLVRHRFHFLLVAQDQMIYWDRLQALSLPSYEQFSLMLDISVAKPDDLAHWEQAFQTTARLAMRHPELLREVMEEKE